MKKIFGIILFLIAFAIGADVKPFIFTQIDTSRETQQAEWDYLLKYKVFGAEGIEFNNQLIRLPDKSGWFGTSHGDFIVEQNGQDTVGGKIIIGGKIFIKQGPLVLTTGPVRADSIVIDQKDNFRGKENFFGGPQCIGGTIPDVYAGFIPDSNRFFNTTCPDSVPTVKTNLFIPKLSTKDTTYQPAIHIDQDHYDTIVVPADTGIYDVYIEGIYATNTGKLFIQMPPDSGRLTRIFLRDGIYLGSAHPRIQILYGDSLINNKDYAGNLLFYTNNDISFESFHNTDTIQGTFISTGTIKIAHHLTLAGQLLANKIVIDTDLDGSGFIFKPFDPPELNFPELDREHGLVENDLKIALPISLDTPAVVDVYFNYCFELNAKVDSSDFNFGDFDFPICGLNTKEIKIPEGSKIPSDTIFVNIKIDTLTELSDSLVIRIDSISGAVLPHNQTSGILKIKIEDAQLKQNTSIVLDKDKTDTTYQEELRIPPGSGVVGNIAYTDDGLVPLVWSFEDPSGFFVVKNGVITTNHIFDYETEDTVYVIKVKVEDGEFADSANYTIKITNIQEDITITTKIDSVKENSIIGTEVGTIIGKDADSTVVSYALKDSTYFKIDQSGVITTNAVFDYETKDRYTITVIITSEDGSKKDANVVVYIGDVDEPVHAHDMIITVPENVNDTIIGKVTGEDEDGDSIKFYSNDTLHYVVDSITGDIRLVEPFDYEKTKSDTLKVIVKDVNGNTDTATVIINVDNVNEPPVLQPNDSLKVKENCDTCTVGIITAIDPDIGDKIIYDVIEQGFKIDSTGTLKTTDSLDYEKDSIIVIHIIAKDTSGASDTLKYTVKVDNVNEPVHVDNKTCTIKENYVGNVCQIPATDEDKDSITYIVIDNTNYEFKGDTLIIKNPIDYEKKAKDTVTVIVTDGEFSDTAQVIIRVLDESEDVKITEWDKNPPPDTVKTNDPDHEFKWTICEGDSCTTHYDNPTIRKDTTIKVCNDKKTVCDSIVVLFNDAPPVVTLTNAKSTDALIDYITIEEEKDDKIYVNKKDNELKVTVRDTIHKTEKTFPIDVKLDTLHVSSKNVTEYNYLIDESLATYTQIGGGLIEVKEVVKDGDRKITLTKIVDKKMNPIDTVQTVTYTVKQDGKELTITYKTDNLTGQRVSDYEVSYKVDSCTTVSYYLGDDKKITKNKEGNIAFTVSYVYTDDFGNKASSKVDIIYDNIPPKVEISDPVRGQSYNTNAIPVKWTVNGIVQDTLNLQRLEKGVNYVIRRYVDKAGNVSADTVMVIMNEAKDIDIELVHPVTMVDQDKVDEYYSSGHKYNDKKPYDVKFVDPKNDTIPDVIGVGFKVDIVLPSVSPTGSLATLDDITKNGQIPVDDNGNIVGASTHGIPVDQYVEEHCTEEFQKDYQKYGLNIPLYDVKYNLHLWVYTNAANYVNDFNIEFTLNDEAKTTSAGTVQMVIDWLADRDGTVKAKNKHALGTGAYLTKLYSKSIAKHRCDYKEQRKGDKTVKKDETMKTFGFKRPNKK